MYVFQIMSHMLVFCHYDKICEPVSLYMGKFILVHSLGSIVSEVVMCHVG